MDHSMPDLRVHHQLPEFTQTHVYRVVNAIQPSHPLIPFSSCPQSFPVSGSFQLSQLFTSGGQSIGVSASTSVLPMNTQDWSPLGWTGWMASPTQWTWVWMDPGSWWWTRRPGMLQFIGSQRVRHDGVTELNWTFFVSAPVIMLQHAVPVQ